MLDIKRLTPNAELFGARYVNATHYYIDLAFRHYRASPHLLGPSRQAIPLPYNFGAGLTEPIYCFSARYGAKSFSRPRSAAMKHTPLCSVTAPVQPSC